MFKTYGFPRISLKVSFTFIRLPFFKILDLKFSKVLCIRKCLLEILKCKLFYMTSFLKINQFIIKNYYFIIYVREYLFTLFHYFIYLNTFFWCNL